MTNWSTPEIRKWLGIILSSEWRREHDNGYKNCSAIRPVLLLFRQPFDCLGFSGAWRRARSAESGDMTINQKPLDGGPLAEIDLVEALRFVNEWEVRNSQAVALRVKIFRNYSV